MASAYLGTSFMPPLFGLIGGKIGYKIFPIYILIFAFLMIIMIEITFHITQKKDK